MQKNKVIKNTLLKANPKVAKEWDIEKNKLDLKFITPNTHKKAGGNVPKDTLGKHQ